MSIHPTAIVSPQAKLGANVTIGPYSIIEDGVTIGDDSVIHAHVHVKGNTIIGKGNHIYSFACIGEIPQDLKFDPDEESRLEVGDNNTIREYVTMNSGTAHGGGATCIGSHNLFMAYSHIAHDCRIGSHIVFANASNLAGHVTVQDHAIVGGLSAIHQFCHVGEGAMVGGGSIVVQDILPFVTAQGNHARAITINKIGMSRRGYGEQEIAAVKRAFRLIFRSGTRRKDALEKLDKASLEFPSVAKMTEFYRNSQRGLAHCRNHR
ncbi:acyl-ACP--UDP-N-acetylglucosamine O-acyltransferase [Desulfurispira natronophila]|uniref:Acyl-[acyl-carrier-protein]--UDP-N-acetylglucosamine O-acyltransferase n=1 Tax=Desulfurispira natronophila TaxID=682562 RepID=A0A7W8DGN3_9BACT|nr:acyl-ACP--UDP-N-acetylglucosamine O-acyltransferase [Desulfurispira natronophila]MBB5021676.1 UDP-N-acetylglucosamine acyltransferase [Desulfurispira natronophila]